MKKINLKAKGFFNFNELRIANNISFRWSHKVNLDTTSDTIATTPKSYRPID
jgi:hypothetical protein